MTNFLGCYRLASFMIHKDFKYILFFNAYLVTKDEYFQHMTIFMIFKQCRLHSSANSWSSYTRTDAVSYNSAATHHDVYDKFLLVFHYNERMFIHIAHLNINKSASEKYKYSNNNNKKGGKKKENSCDVPLRVQEVSSSWVGEMVFFTPEPPFWGRGPHEEFHSGFRGRISSQGSFCTQRPPFPPDVFELQPAVQPSPRRWGPECGACYGGGICPESHRDKWNKSVNWTGILSISCVKNQSFSFSLGVAHSTGSCLTNPATFSWYSLKTAWFRKRMNFLELHSKVAERCHCLHWSLRKTLLTSDSNKLWNQRGFVVSCRGTEWHALNRQVLLVQQQHHEAHSLESPPLPGRGEGRGPPQLRTEHTAERSNWSTRTDLRRSRGNVTAAMHPGKLRWRRLACLKNIIISLKYYNAKTRSRKV